MDYAEMDTVVGSVAKDIKDSETALEKRVADLEYGVDVNTIDMHNLLQALQRIEKLEEEIIALQIRVHNLENDSKNYLTPQHIRNMHYRSNT